MGNQFKINMKFVILAAIASFTQAIKLGDDCANCHVPSQTGNYSPRADEYSDYHPHAQTYTWDSTGGHPSLNRMRQGYDQRSHFKVDDNGQGHGDGQIWW